MTYSKNPHIRSNSNDARCCEGGAEVLKSKELDLAGREARRCLSLHVKSRLYASSVPEENMRLFPTADVVKPTLFGH